MRSACPRRAPLWALLVLAASAGLCSPGPMNTALVVNADSWASLAVANEYQRLRGIPARNVLYIGGLPDHEQVSVEVFREQILKPVLTELQRRGVHRQIDCIAYSADMPCRIDVSADVEDKKLPHIITPFGSINGLTYLCQDVLYGNVRYLSLRPNRYARVPRMVLDARELSPADVEVYTGAVKMMREKKWGQALEVLQRLDEAQPGVPEVLYNLGCCLSRVGRLEEAVAALRRAADAGLLSYPEMARDDDLAPVREREDFKALIEYMRIREVPILPTRGCRFSSVWGPRGEPGAAEGPSYMLSMVLGYTSGRGNSLGEVLGGLRRAAAADATHPQGTVYYMVNDDIRSVVRQWAFEHARAMLAQLHVGAEVIRGVVPDGRSEVAGLMAGTAGFSWPKGAEAILPGAICEHFTSYGGVLTDGASQTPLTEFIRLGAAAASGTVTEPYAIAAKFPDAFLHVHYAYGSTAVEAFYQSLAAPYQLLIVGDPLCRPWAAPPTVALPYPAPDEAVSGTVHIAPTVDGGASTCELYVDGLLRGSFSVGEGFDLDTRALADGYHELVVSVLSDDMVQVRGEVTVALFVDNAGHRLELTAPDGPEVPLGGTLRLWARMSQPGRILLAHNGRVVGEIQGPEGETWIDTTALGLGPVRIEAAGIAAESSEKSRVMGKPVVVTVVPPHAMQAVTYPPQTARDKGLLLQVEGREPLPIETTAPHDWLKRAKVAAGARFTLEAGFEVPATDMYQFQLRTDGAATLEVDGTPVASSAEDRWQLAPLCLGKGTHRIRVEGKAGPERRLHIRFGGPGARSLSGQRFRHVKP